MKKRYEEPEAEVILVMSGDIMTGSNGLEDDEGTILEG